MKNNRGKNQILLTYPELGAGHMNFGGWCLGWRSVNKKDDQTRREKFQ